MNNFPVTVNGKEYWISRSLAVAVSVYGFVDNKLCILANKRGPGLPNNVGKWNVVSGFIDYNETIEQCCKREVWEETGIDISTCELHRMSIEDDPKRDGQVILFRYICFIYKDKGKDIMKGKMLVNALTTEHSEPNEVSDLKWIPLDELDKYEWTSENHKNKIKEYGEYMLTYNSTCRTIYRYAER